MTGLQDLSLPFAAGLFAVAAAAVWWAGGALSVRVSALADKVGLSQGFAGMLLLGGITSLPEVATAGSAALTGSPDLAVANLIGTASINVLLLVAADLLIAGAAITALARSSSGMLQGILAMLLMMGIAAVAIVGDREIGGLGLGVGTTGLFAGACGALWLASRYERAPGWTVADDDGSGRGEATDDKTEERPLRGLVLSVAGLAAVILGAGFVLAQTADGIARDTGLGAGLIGLTLVGLATSLPELSSIRTALKIKRYDLAIGDVFGTNLFNVAVLFVIDVAWRDGAALEGAGAFEALAALMAAAMMGLFIAGLLARRNEVALRLGASSWAIVGLYVGGLIVLSRLPAATSG
jgi:cation:H+ antiporter